MRLAAWLFAVLGIAAPLLFDSPSPPPIPVAAGVAAASAAVAAPVRSEVYLYQSMMGPRSWAELSRPHSPLVEPGKDVADQRWFLGALADRANEMGVDGIVLTTLHIPAPEGDPDRWRIRMEGRLDCLRSDNPAPADAAAITSGMAELGRRFRGRVILYTGCPDDRDPAIVRDPAWCDSYVRASLGPYLDARRPDGRAVVRYVIVDSLGGSPGSRPASKAVSASIRRQWPDRELGGEPHPLDAQKDGMSCSFTSEALLRTTNVFRGLTGRVHYAPIAGMPGPLIVGYTTSKEGLLAHAMELVRAGRCVAIQAHHVGYGKRTPSGYPDGSWRVVPASAADRAAWDKFMADVRDFRRPPVPPPSPPPPPPAPLPPSATSAVKKPRRHTRSPRGALRDSVRRPLLTRPLGERPCHVRYRVKHCSLRSSL